MKNKSYKWQQMIVMKRKFKLQYKTEKKKYLRKKKRLNKKKAN